MKHRFFFRLAALAPALLAAAAGLAQDGGFTSLFNGRDLSGWKTKGAAEFLVRDGCLVGTQNTGKGGDIWTEAEYRDFELRATYKVKWPANSGFWFRWNPETAKGYQFDILKYKKPEAYSGTIYCPGKLFIATNTVATVENDDGWNDARIWARGDRMIVWLNGKRVGDARDNTFAGGAIGIQVHPGDVCKGMEIVVKDIRVRPVAADEPVPSN
jgi:hypothetical protein